MKSEYNHQYYLAHKEYILGKWPQYYSIHKEMIKKHLKEKRDALKLAILGHYSTQGLPRCARCEINDIDVLTLDHINGGGNAHRRQIGILRGGTRFYQWLVKNNLPEGYQVLCANCNLKKQIVEKT